jgi:hypothetical protein
MVDDFGLAISRTDQDLEPVVAQDVLRFDPLAAGSVDGSHAAALAAFRLTMRSVAMWPLTGGW